WVTGEKLVPSILTEIPCAAIGGNVPVISSSGIVKSLADVVTVPWIDTVILPSVASWGTTTVSVVAVASFTSASAPLNLTMFSEAIVLKLEPDIVTVVPATPDSGVNDVIVVLSGVNVAEDRKSVV